MSDPQRILFIRLSALGDVVLATPALRALRRRFPNAEIDWLVEANYMPLLEACPHARPLAYDKRGRHAGFGGLLALRRELARRRYDLVVDLQGKPKTLLVGSVGSRRVRLVKRSPVEALRALAGRERPLERAHAIDLFLEALAPLGVEPDGRQLELALTPAMQAETDGLRLGDRVAALAPGSRWATKRWPPERFAALARVLAARGFQILLAGGPGDASAFAQVRGHLPPNLEVADTSGLSVGGLAAAIARCRVLVTGDSGPAHVACAVGTPPVVLFGPTSPRRWGPLSDRGQVVRAELECSPCSNHGTASCARLDHECLRSVQVDRVVQAVDRAVAA